MFYMILYCFPFALEKRAAADVQSESARGGPKVLGGVQEKNIPNRREEWELENQLLAP